MYGQENTGPRNTYVSVVSVHTTATPAQLDSLLALRFLGLLRGQSSHQRLQLPLRIPALASSHCAPIALLSLPRAAQFSRSVPRDTFSR